MIKRAIFLLPIIFIATQGKGQTIVVTKDAWQKEITVASDSIMTIPTAENNIDLLFISKGRLSSYGYSWMHNIKFSVSGKDNGEVESIYLKAGMQEPVKGTLLEGNFLLLSNFEIQEIKRKRSASFRIYFPMSKHIQLDLSERQVDYFLSYIDKAESEKL